MNCPHTFETATVFNRTDAERHANQLARDLRMARPLLPEEVALDLARASIITKNPRLLITCNACKRERLE